MENVDPEGSLEDLARIDGLPLFSRGWVIFLAVAGILLMFAQVFFCLENRAQIGILRVRNGNSQTGWTAHKPKVPL